MASVMESTRSFLYKRRRPLVIIGGIAGGFYVAGKYALDKLRQMQIKMVEERRDKENLRRRFAQNQEDCTFTVLALLPTLGDQLFEKMNVEELTSMLQKSRITAPPPQPQEANVAPVASEEIAGTNGHAVGSEEQVNGTNGASRSEEQSPGYQIAGQEVNGSEKEAEAHNTEEGLNSMGGKGAVEAQEAADAEAQKTAQGAAQETAQETEREASQERAQETEQKASEAQAAPRPALSGAEIDNGSASEGIKSSTKTADTQAAAPHTHPVALNAAAKPFMPGQAAHKAENGKAQDEETRPSLPASTSALDTISEPPPPPISPDARLTPTEQSVSASTEPAAAAKEAAPAEGAASAEEGAPVEEAAPVEEVAHAEDVAPAKENLVEQEPPAYNEEDILREKKAKLALWNELKIVAFSRTLTAIYAIVLLTLQTHIQLNLIGRYAYLASVNSLAKPAPPHHQIDVNAGDDASFDQSFAQEALRQRMDSVDEEEAGLSHDTERVYLTFSWWFLHRGWDGVATRVRTAVEETFGQLPLKAQLSWPEFLKTLSSARRKVEYEVLGEDTSLPGGGLRSSGVSEVSATTRGSRRLLARRLNFLEALFPSTLEEELEVLIAAGAVPANTPISALEADVQLRNLLDETKDFIDSRDFRSVLRLCLDRVFGIFQETMKPSFGIEETEDVRFQELSEDGEIGRRVRLAALFPAVAKQSQLAIHGAPNEYVESLSDVKELRALSAIIYSSWSKSS